MTVIQNAFANTSSSLVISKVQGNIVDTLMPPLVRRWRCCWAISQERSVARGTLVAMGIGLGRIGADAGAGPGAPADRAGVRGARVRRCWAALGVVAGVFAEKFDQMAAITNFIVTPLAFLSGTFYSVEALPPVLKDDLLHLNPVFYLIDGVRFGCDRRLGQPATWLGLAVCGGRDHSPVCTAGLGVAAQRLSAQGVNGLFGREPLLACGLSAVFCFPDAGEVVPASSAAPPAASSACGEDPGELA